jgi:hypothetical protein
MGLSDKVETVQEGVEDKDGIPCSITDIERVIGIMKQYKRKRGYIAFVGNTLEFFDSEPSEGGAPITLKIMEESLVNVKKARKQ